MEKLKEELNKKTKEDLIKEILGLRVEYEYYYLYCQRLEAIIDEKDVKIEELEELEKLHWDVV